MWELIDKSIIASSQDIVNAGKYDDAIFAAFRQVEASIQERIRSTSIGEALIAEGFDGDPPKVNISKDTRDRQGIRDLFSGALKISGMIEVTRKNRLHPVNQRMTVYCI